MVHLNSFMRRVTVCGRGGNRHASVASPLLLVYIIPVHPACSEVCNKMAALFFSSTAGNPVVMGPWTLRGRGGAGLVHCAPCHAGQRCRHSGDCTHTGCVPSGCQHGPGCGGQLRRAGEDIARPSRAPRLGDVGSSHGSSVRGSACASKQVCSSNVASRVEYVSTLVDSRGSILAFGSLFCIQSKCFPPVPSHVETQEAAVRLTKVRGCCWDSYCGRLCVMAGYSGPCSGKFQGPL